MSQSSERWSTGDSAIADATCSHRPFGGWRMAAGVFVLAAVTHVDGWFGPMHCDASAWLYIAQQRDRGLVPYRDLWENKPPPIIMLYRLAWKLGHVRAACFVFDVGLIALSGWFLWRVAATFLQPVSAVTAALLYVLITAHPSLHYGGGITEAYALPFAVLGFCLAALYRLSGGGWRAFACGVAWSWAIAFRMPAIVSLVSLLPLCQCRCDAARGGTRSGLCAAVVAGGAAGGLLAVLDPIVGEYFWEFLDVCVLWNVRYAMHETPSATVSWNTALGRFLSNLSIWGGLHVAALLGFVVFWTRRARFSAWTRVVVLAGMCWYFADLLGTFPTLHQYPHHHYMTLGSLALAAAVCMDQMIGNRGRWGLVRYAPVAMAVGYAGVIWFVHVREKLPEARDVPGVREAAAFLRHSTRPDEPVLLWVWHEEAELFWRVDRPPAARHFMPAAAFVYDLEMAQRTCEEMLNSPPRYIADSSPYLPLLGMPPDIVPATRYEAIRARYRDLYEPVTRFGRIAIYRRKDENR